MNQYDEYSKIFKALSDPTRLEIIDMLSCGEMCACNILKKFNFSQPALSHHMKVLSASGLVTADRKGAWMHYSLNAEKYRQMISFIAHISSDKEDCVCKEILDLC